MLQVPLWSVLLLIVGSAFVLWPYQITKAHEIVDAIGRRSAGPVEPAEWYVTLTRIGGGMFILIGIVGLFGALS
jgi:hypothetical protein